MNRIEKLALFLAVFVPFALAGILLHFTIIGNQIDLWLGEYGVRIQQALGTNSGAVGTWWNGYLLFENNVMQLLIWTFGFGAIVGSIFMVGLLKTIQQKELGGNNE